MSKFEIAKLPVSIPKIKGVMYRIPDFEPQEALEKALKDSGKSAQELVNEMVRHCLKESGYLK